MQNKFPNKSGVWIGACVGYITSRLIWNEKKQALGREILFCAAVIVVVVNFEVGFLTVPGSAVWLDC